MKRICMFLCLMLVMHLLPVTARADAIDGAIRVYLKSMGDIDRLGITTEGGYTVNASEDMRFASGAQITVTAYEDSLYLTCGEMTLEMGDTLTLARHGNAGGLYLEDSQRGLLYMGDLEMTLRDGCIVPILVIGLEDYLMGVVPYEMSDSFPLEALKAQAVAARTYVLRMRQSGASRGYDVVDTPSDQVFMGYDPGVSNAIAACRETEGMVGMYNGDFATCYYTASNGGQTALPSDIWGSGGEYGYLSRRDDPYDVANNRSVVKSAVIGADGTGLTDEMHRLLLAGASESLASLGYSDEETDCRLDKIIDMQTVEAEAEESRCYTVLRVTCTLQGRPLVEKEPETEAATDGPAPAPGSTPQPAPTPEYILGDWETVETEFTVDIPIFDTVKDGLKLGINSGDYELFTVTVQRNEADEAEHFSIEARRYGHGVGMSQRGAQEMAGAYGMTCEEILGFYYPGMDVDICEVAHETRDVLPPLFGKNDGDLPELQAGERYGTVRVAGISSALNVRAQPTTQADIIAQAYEGDRLIVGEEVESGWYAVRSAQLTGYAAAEYIELE